MASRVRAHRTFRNRCARPKQSPTRLVVCIDFLRSGRLSPSTPFSHEGDVAGEVWSIRRESGLSRRLKHSETVALPSRTIRRSLPAHEPHEHPPHVHMHAFSMTFLPMAMTTLGGPLAGTQPFEKFFSKPGFGCPNGLLPPGNPSIQVGGFAPHLN